MQMTSVEFQKVFLDGKRHNKAFDSPRDISMLPPLKQSSSKFQRMYTEEGGISSKRDNVGPEQLEDIISQLDGGKDVKHSLQQYHQNSRARQQQALEHDETSFKIQGSVFDALSNDLNDPQRSQNGIRSRLDGKKSSMGDVNGPRQAKKGSTMIITSPEQERARSPIPVYQLPNTPKVDDAFTPTSGAQREDVTSAKETTSAEKKKENYFQKKKQVQPLDPIKEMDIILRQMKSRDCQANIVKMQDELRSVLQQRSINTNARISHYKLASVRKLIPKEFLMPSNNQGSGDYDRINLTLLNEYLNKYSEKLSRSNAFNPSEIKIDFGQYDNILCGIENQTFNPFNQHLEEKNKQKRDKGKIKNAKPKFLNHFVDEVEEQRKRNPIMTEIIEKVEKEELQQELKVIVDKLDSIPSKVHNGFLKGTDINNFEKYKTVMMGLKQRQMDPMQMAQMLRGQTPHSQQSLMMDTTMGKIQRGSFVSPPQTAFKGGFTQPHHRRLFSQGGGEYNTSSGRVALNTNLRTSTASLPRNTETPQQNQHRKLFAHMSESVSLLSQSDAKIETIGTIWKNSQKIVKDNKRFKRVHERKLNKLSSEINHLNTLVNQSLSVVKKERERFRLEKQENILRMFQLKADQQQANNSRRKDSKDE
ncbi:hypothetical protein FGO68_gene8510 [Halteria grandinella]|uniref:Uncharacterized protein n=1 Tax=Halteria grandinella TaxID=5974 RepID=A0A8J8NGC4_HALGN|nr:hypothetical protein FGO68_gene8510 [Halteria grandinella]